MTTSTHHQTQSPPREHRHSHPVLEAIISVSRCAEFLRAQVDKAVEPLSITGVQYNILRVLKRAHPEGLSRSEVLRELIEKSVDVTRSIDGLIKAGYVERTRPEKDRRLSITTITEKGIQALGEVDPYFYAMMQAMGTALSEEEFRHLAELCRKLQRSHSE